MKITTTGLSLLEVREKYPECFYSQSWYDNEAFATEKPEAGTWEFDFTSKHASKTYAQHKKTLKKGYAFPHPAVLAEALCIHFKESGERLLPDWWSRTNSLNSDGDRVCVGDFGDSGLVVNVWSDGRLGSLGVASARKIETGTIEPVHALSLEARIMELEAFRDRVVELIPSLKTL